MTIESHFVGGQERWASSERTRISDLTVLVRNYVGQAVFNCYVFVVVVV